jgi:hypothetical protein
MKSVTQIRLPNLKLNGRTGTRHAVCSTGTRSI